LKRIYLISLIAVLAGYGFLMVRFIGIGPVMPFETDETQHYLNSKTFASYNSLKASAFANEDIAKITGADWYGPGYPIFFGTFRKLMLGSDKSYIYTNFLLLITIIFLLLKFNWAPIEGRLLAVLGLLLTPALLSYLFYFMPSVLDLFFATLLLLLIWRIYIADDAAKIKRMILFCVCTIAIALIKENFIFSIVAIAPFLKGRKQHILAAIGFFVGLIVVMGYAALFMAPSYLKSVIVLNQLLTFKFSGLVEMRHLLGKVGAVIITNIKDVIHHSGVPTLYLLSYWMLFTIPFINLYMGYRLKNSLLTSFALVSAFMIIVYITLYTTYWHFMIRISIPLILFNFAALVLWIKEYRIAQLVILGGLLILLPWNILSVKEQQDIRSRAYTQVEVLKNTFGKPLAKSVGCTEHDVTTILYDSKLWEKHGQLFALALPLADSCNNRIRYTINLDVNDRYKLWGKLHIDYILSSIPLQLQNSKLIDGNQDFYLYKL